MPGNHGRTVTMTSPAVFFTPHQDDETLSMGYAIRNHLRAGRQVHVVLMTDGSNSGVRASTGLSVAEFVAARDDEYRRACRRVGVRPDNIHISPIRPADGALDVAAAESVMLDFLDDFPNADVKTYSPYPATGRHLDHQHAGQALAKLLESDEVETARFYVEPWLRAAFIEANPSVHLAAETTPDLAITQGAFDEYGTKDPSGWKFGIGKASVPSAWTAGRADPTSWYHLPPA
jgi:LmbE family N-acetylglucosaminyl deacetylase